jgi:hypothetical protein
MSHTDELERLKSMSNDLSLPAEQRAKARQARDRMIEDEILANWEEVEARGAQYDVLVGQLKAIVDDIQANRTTSAIDDLNSVLTDVQAAAG